MFEIKRYSLELMGALTSHLDRIPARMSGFKCHRMLFQHRNIIFQIFRVSLDSLPISKRCHQLVLALLNITLNTEGNMGIELSTV